MLLFLATSSLCTSALLMLNTYKYWQLLRQYVQHLVVCVYQPLFIRLSADLDLYFVTVLWKDGAQASVFHLTVVIIP